MPLIAAIRRRQTRWTRRVVAAFVLSWVAIVAQPCVMALGGDSEHDCPHCPPAHEMHAGGHAQHGAPAPAGTGCVDSAGDCDRSDIFKHDGRAPHPEPKDAPDETPVALLPLPLHAPAASGGVPDGSVARIVPPGVPPPLHLLHCTFLN